MPDHKMSDKRTLMHTLIWGLYGAGIGGLLGAVVLFWNYMAPDSNVSPTIAIRPPAEVLQSMRHAKAEEHSNITLTSRTVSLLPDLEPSSLDFADSNDMVTLVGEILLDGARARKIDDLATPFDKLLPEPSDRSRAISYALRKLDASTFTFFQKPEDSEKAQVGENLEAGLNELGKAIQRLLPPDFQVRNEVELALAFYKHGFDKDARDFVQQIAKAVESPPPASAPKSNVGQKSKGAESAGSPPARPWAGWWPIGLGAIGFCMSTMMRPILEALGRVVFGNLLAKLTKNEEPRKGSSLEVNAAAANQDAQAAPSPQAADPTAPPS